MRQETAKLNQNLFLEVSKTDPVSDLTEFVRHCSQSDAIIDLFILNKLNASLRCITHFEDKDQCLYEIKLLKGRFLNCSKNKSIFVYSDKEKKNSILTCRKEALSKTIKTGISMIKEEIDFLSKK